MRKRIAVISVESRKDTSQKDMDDFEELLELIADRYHIKWAVTMNPEWVRALADEMDKSEEERNQ